VDKFASHAGRANLEVFAQALSPGDIFFAVDLTTLQGKHILLTTSAFAAAAAAGGAGGMWRRVVAGQGLWDPQDPWDNPPGDLIVQVRHLEGFIPLFCRPSRPRAAITTSRHLGPRCQPAVGQDFVHCLGGSAMGAAASPGVQAARPLCHMHAQVRYPGFQLGRSNVRSCLRPQALHLLGSSSAAVPAAMVGGCLAATLSHRLAAEELNLEQAVGGQGAQIKASSCGALGEEASTLAGPPAAAAAAVNVPHAGQQLRPRAPVAVCLSIIASPGLSQGEGPAGGRGASPAAKALLAVLQKRVAGLKAHTIALPVALQPPQAWSASLAGGGGDGSSGPLPCPAELPSVMGLLDDEWCMLHEADIIILDASCGRSDAQMVTKEEQEGAGAQGALEERALAAAVEGALAWLGRSAEGAGLAQALWGAFWRGAHLVGVGGACALLGQQPQHSTPTTIAAPLLAPAPAILPWYLLRVGGGEDGWVELHAAVQGAAATAVAAAAAAASGASPPPAAAGAAGGAKLALVGVGVMAGSACIVDPCTGAAELLVAPTRCAMHAVTRGQQEWLQLLPLSANVALSWKGPPGKTCTAFQLPCLCTWPVSWAGWVLWPLQGGADSHGSLGCCQRGGGAGRSG
jgi:hypothetical protein